MSAITPVGYTLLRDARFAVAGSFKAGHPFTEAVDKALSAGVDTRLDRGELNRAAAFIQDLVADGTISVLLLRPSSGAVMQVPADVLKGIPFADASGGELNFLREPDAGENCVDVHGALLTEDIAGEAEAEVTRSP